MPPVIDKDKCSSCGTCADICPMDVLYLSKENDLPEVKYPEECWHCNACKLDCPEEAIKLRIPLPATMLYVDSPKKQ